MFLLRHRQSYFNLHFTETRIIGLSTEDHPWPVAFGQKFNIPNLDRREFPAPRQRVIGDAQYGSLRSSSPLRSESIRSEAIGKSLK